MRYFSSEDMDCVCYIEEETNNVIIKFFNMEDNEKIPYFIQIRGCINCDASKRLKEKTGKDYGFDHVFIVKCLFMGCNSEGHDLTHPYYDPEEIVRLVKEKMTQN